MKKISFTRLGKQGVKDGWQAVNISPDAPPELIGRYAALQNANTPPAPVFEPEDSVEQTITELQTDNHYVYLTKIKYGLADEQGRPSMFADSFVCDIKRLTESPDKVLRLLKKSNFRFEIGDSPESHLSEAADCELAPSEIEDSAFFPSLLKCVYSVCCEQRAAKEPLHIICDCSDKTIASVMCCLYRALLLPLRKSLMFTTYEKGSHKTIVFSRRIAQVESDSCNLARRRYFDLSTGETNMPESTLKKLSTYGFIDDIANSPKAATLDYFKSFEDALREYGCGEVTNLNLYKFVYDMNRIDDILRGDNAELLKKLNELLSISLPNRKALDEQILRLFTTALERNIEPNDVLISKLASASSASHNKTLICLCAVCVYTRALACAGDSFTDFFDGASEMTFEIYEEPPEYEFPDDDFSDDDDEYEEERFAKPAHPIKNLIKKFTHKKP